jgi:hypothetical protein
MKTLKEKQANPFLEERLSIPVGVKREAIIGLLCSMVEDTHNDWLVGIDENKTQPPAGHDYSDYERGGSRNPTTGDLYAWDAFYILAVTPGAKMTWQVLDPSDNDGEKTLDVEVTSERILSGLQKMAENNPYQFSNLMNEKADAITGYVFGQYVVYGEEIYG